MDFRFGDALRVSWLLASFTLSCGVQPRARAHAVASASSALSALSASSQPNVLSAQEAQSAGGAGGMKAMPRPTCTESKRAPPHLQSIVNIKPREVYWANVSTTDREWALAEPVVAPLHHAVRLEFTNQGEFSAVALQPQQVARASFEVIAQDIEQAADRPLWRNTIRVRLLDVCPLAR